MSMTDDTLSELIGDPALIETHEIALEVLDTLDAEIAQIQTQIDAATIEANIRPLSSDRRAWLQRAAYACAMRRNERHRVIQRDKEIRGTKFNQPKKDPAEGIAKQERLRVEAEVKRMTKAAEIERQKTMQLELEQERRKLNERRTFNHNFQAVAKRLLPPSTYAEIVSAANNMMEVS